MIVNITLSKRNIQNNILTTNLTTNIIQRTVESKKEKEKKKVYNIIYLHDLTRRIFSDYVLDRNNNVKTNICHYYIFR